MDHAFSAHGNLRLPRDDETFRQAKEFRSPAVYWIQLIVNFIWPLIFFNLSIYGIALAWLILLIILVIYMIFQFHDITPRRRMAAGTLSALADLCGLSQCGHLAAELKK